MQSDQIIMQLLLGALLGLTGQILRIIVGLKKMNDTASTNGTTFKDEFQTSLLITSILIGIAAGILAMVAQSDFKTPVQYNREVILGLIAAGYAGTDFIEGLIKKYLPNTATKK